MKVNLYPIRHSAIIAWVQGRTIKPTYAIDAEGDEFISGYDWYFDTEKNIIRKFSKETKEYIDIAVDFTRKWIITEENSRSFLLGLKDYPDKIDTIMRTSLRAWNNHLKQRPTHWDPIEVECLRLKMESLGIKYQFDERERGCHRFHILDDADFVMFMFYFHDLVGKASKEPLKID